MIWAHLAYPPSVDPLGLRLLSAGRPKGACPVHPEPQGQVPGQQIVPQVDQPPPVGHLRLPAQEEPPEVPHFPDRTQWRPGHRLARPAACWAATCLDRREIQRDHDLAHAYRQVALRQPLAQVGSPQQVLIQTVKPRAFVHASRHTELGPFRPPTLRLFGRQTPGKNPAEFPGRPSGFGPLGPAGLPPPPGSRPRSPRAPRPP